MNKLILLGTTIGNVEDISIRAFRAIFESPIILAEDTRVFAKFKTILKERYGSDKACLVTTDVKQTVLSYREQNHDRVLQHILRYLENTDVVLTTDAGMPGISDPGYLLVRDVIAAGFEVDVIPGPTAVSTALVLSGLPSDRYTFVGFLPRRKIRIENLISAYDLESTTLIFFESPFRLAKTLEVLQTFLPEHTHVAACGELTKKFQRIERGSIPEVITAFEKQPARGEWVVCVRGGSE